LRCKRLKNVIQFFVCHSLAFVFDQEISGMLAASGVVAIVIGLVRWRARGIGAAAEQMYRRTTKLGFRGGIGDANRGDEQLGWDTDQFPTDIYLTTQCMLSIMKMGGFKTGGVNFDAKVRRESFEPVDLFYAHIGGMDAFARGLKIASAIRKDGRLADFVKERYSSYDSGVGAKIEAGKMSFKELEAYMLKKGEAEANTSGRQEFLENLINEFI